MFRMQDGEHERLEGIGDSKREIIRDNDQVWLYTDGHKVRVEKRQIKRAFPALLPEQIILVEGKLLGQSG